MSKTDRFCASWDLQAKKAKVLLYGKHFSIQPYCGDSENKISSHKTDSADFKLYILKCKILTDNSYTRLFFHLLQLKTNNDCRILCV